MTDEQLAGQASIAKVPTSELLSNHQTSTEQVSSRRIPSTTLSLLSCSLCGQVCKRAVSLSCCGPVSQACRSCAVKRVTADRSCWSCQRTDLSLTEDLRNCQELREACSWFREHGRLESHQMEELRKLREMTNTGTEVKSLEKLGEKEKEKCRELLKKEDIYRERLEKKELKEKEWLEKEEKMRREEREIRRKKEKEKRQESDKEERRKRKELEKIFDKQRKEAWEKRKKELAEERILEEEARKKRELEEVEIKVNERIEEIITNLVEEQLEMKKKEIENEVLKKVRLARINMEKELKEEIAAMKKLSQERERARKIEFEKYVVETEKRLEEERKQIAEERLELLAEREKIEKELRKQKKRDEKKLKDEQSKILGKDKSRPKLSFSLSK